MGAASSTPEPDTLGITTLPKGSLVLKGSSSKRGYPDEPRPGPLWFAPSGRANWFARKYGLQDSAKIVAYLYGCKNKDQVPHIITLEAKRDLRLFTVTLQSLRRLRKTLRSRVGMPGVYRSLAALDIAFFGQNDLVMNEKGNLNPSSVDAAWYISAGTRGKPFRPDYSLGVDRLSLNQPDTLFLLTICRLLRLDGYLSTSKKIEFHPEGAVCDGKSSFIVLKKELCEQEYCERMNQSTRGEYQCWTI